MDRDELGTFIIKIKKMLPVLEKAYCRLDDEDLERKIGQIHLPCDSCDEKDGKIFKRT